MDFLGLCAEDGDVEVEFCCLGFFDVGCFLVRELSNWSSKTEKVFVCCIECLERGTSQGSV